MRCLKEAGSHANLKPELQARTYFWAAFSRIHRTMTLPPVSPPQLASPQSVWVRARDKPASDMASRPCEAAAQAVCADRSHGRMREAWMPKRGKLLASRLHGVCHRHLAQPTQAPRRRVLAVQRLSSVSMKRGDR